LIWEEMMERHIFFLANHHLFKTLNEDLKISLVELNDTINEELFIGIQKIRNIWM
jgi:hypothetical protein